MEHNFSKNSKSTFWKGLFIGLLISILVYGVVYYTQTSTITALEERIKTQKQNQDQVVSCAWEVLEALHDNDYTKLSQYIHPEKGVRFTPYTYVNVDKDIVLFPEQIENLLANNKIYNWGAYDGSGKPILLPISEYFSEFVYNRDYLRAEQIGYNVFIGQDTMINNIREVYTDSIIIEYYFSGNNEMDWSSLRLVFQQHEKEWYLTGIVHSQWTI